MIRIGVLSDTHLDRATERFKATIKDIFKDVDTIIHAGDMTAYAVYDYLHNWNLVAVRGNMDDFDLSGILPEKRIEVISGIRIGIIHGRGGPDGIEDIVFSEFSDVDLIIFGHSHVPAKTKKGNTILFNPGTHRGYASQPGTVGIIEIDNNTIRFEHLIVG